MILRSRVRDCLFLNWALPRAALGDPPGDLRYQEHQHAGERWVFASALLFRQQGIHLSAAAWARVSYPQLNLRYYILDRDDVPSVLFVSMWAPLWVVPAARLIARQPVHSASLRYPDRVEQADTPSTWQVRAGESLQLSAAGGSAVTGQGPRLGGWAETVRYFRQRPRGYTEGARGLRRIETSHVSTTVWPMEVELVTTSLLDACVGLPPGEWPALHSAWICPQLTFELELLPESEAALGRRVPAPG